MENIRSIIRESINQMILKESSEAFAKKISSSDVIKGNQIVSKMIKDGSNSKFDYNFIDDAKISSKENNGVQKDTTKSNIFDYVIEKIIEIYKTPIGETVKLKVSESKPEEEIRVDSTVTRNIRAALQVAFNVYSPVLKAFVYFPLMKSNIIQQGKKFSGYNDKINDALMYAWEQIIENGLEKQISAYSGNGSFTSLINQMMRYRVLDFFKLKDQKAGKISLDAPLPNSGTVGDILQGKEDKGEASLGSDKFEDMTMAEKAKAIRDKNLKIYEKMKKDFNPVQAEIFKYKALDELSNSEIADLVISGDADPILIDHFDKKSGNLLANKNALQSQINEETKTLIKNIKYEGSKGLGAEIENIFGSEKPFIKMNRNSYAQYLFGHLPKVEKEKSDSEYASDEEIEKARSMMQEHRCSNKRLLEYLIIKENIKNIILENIK